MITMQILFSLFILMFVTVRIDANENKTRTRTQSGDIFFFFSILQICLMEIDLFV